CMIAATMLTVRNLTKSYRTSEEQLAVLRGVDLASAAGESVALTGESGSGKSTSSRCVNSSEVPDRGTLEIGPERVEFEPGEKLSRDQVQRVRMQTGMVFQNFQSFPHQTVIG
ncbi:hypothetical protein OY671_012202, partial [Metschnikowia pulcherrima]